MRYLGFIIIGFSHAMAANYAGGDIVSWNYWCTFLVLIAGVLIIDNHRDSE